jgi:hypothetical protein
MTGANRLLISLAALVAFAASSTALAQDSGEALSPGAAAFKLRQVVAAYEHWRGGDAFEALETVHEKLYAEDATSSSPDELWMARDGRKREAEIDAGQQLVALAGPDGAWGLGAWKPKDPASDVEKARRMALLEFGDAFEGRGGALAQYIGTADQQDHTWAVIRVTFGDADTYDALIDADLGVLCCYRITENGVQRLVMFGDWRLLDGVRMPYAWLSHATTDVGYRVRAIELNQTFDAALFKPPPGGG